MQSGGLAALPLACPERGDVEFDSIEGLQASGRAVAGTLNDAIGLSVEFETFEDDQQAVCVNITIENTETGCQFSESIDPLYEATWFKSGGTCIGGWVKLDVTALLSDTCSSGLGARAARPRPHAWRFAPGEQAEEPLKDALLEERPCGARPNVVGLFGHRCFSLKLLPNGSRKGREQITW